VIRGLRWGLCGYGKGKVQRNSGPQRPAKDANQAHRLLSLAAIRDGMSRTEAARIGGMDRQTLRDWVHAYNEHGIEGLINATSPGRPPKLSPDHKAEIKALVEKGP
jgi:transposase